MFEIYATFVKVLASLHKTYNKNRATKKSVLTSGFTAITNESPQLGAHGI
jgi:hypothetical protein